MAIKLRDTVIFEKQAEGEYLLDVKGYGCPHVQVYAEKALHKVGDNERLTIVFDNPSSGESINYLSLAEGYTILDRQEAGGTFTWKIQKG